MRLILHGIYLLLHLAVLGVFVLGLGARHVHPAAVWWLQPLAIGLPVVAGALLLLTLAAAAMQRWILVAFSVTALALFAARYASALTNDLSVEGEALTVVTFNSGGVEPGERDNRGIRQLITAAEPDLICLQEFGVGHRGSEARAHHTLQPLIDSLDYEIAAPRPPDGHRSPPPVITNLEIEQTSVIGLSTYSETDPAGTVIRAQLSWHGRSFVVYNVHLQSFSMRRPWTQGETFSPRAWIRFIRRTSSAFIQRASEATEIRRMLESEELPFLLCGDFNSTPHQWTYFRLAEDLRDVFRTHGGLWGPTFPARFPLFRIDYILASDDWIVEEAAVGPHLPPDHRPVIAQLHLKPESADM